MELTLTGEKKTVSVTDATTYTINGEDGTLDDLQTDDIVTIALADDETAEAVRSGMGKGGNDQGPGGGAPDGSTEGEAV